MLDKASSQTSSRNNVDTGNVHSLDHMADANCAHSEDKALIGLMGSGFKPGSKTNIELLPAAIVMKAHGTGRTIHFIFVRV